MKQYATTVRRRVFWLTLAVALCAAILVWGVARGYFARQDDYNFHFQDFLAGYQLGGLVGITLALVAKIFRNTRALRDEARLKAMYIKEHDERTQLIWAKSGGTVMYVCSIALLLAGIAGGYFSPTVFYTLLSAAMFLLVVKMGCKLYYGRKL